MFSSAQQAHRLCQGSPESLAALVAPCQTPEICSFQQRRVEFLGYLVDPSRWRVDLRSVEATLSWQAPVKGQTPPSFFLTKNMERWQWR